MGGRTRPEGHDEATIDGGHAEEDTMVRLRWGDAIMRRGGHDGERSLAMGGGHEEEATCTTSITRSIHVQKGGGSSLPQAEGGVGRLA